MKIAIMLALHNAPQQANFFIQQCLLYPECEIFIHVDKKGTWIIDELIRDQRIHVLPLHLSTQWGDFSQIEFAIELMRYALNSGQFAYYSLHSGNDLMVRPWDQLTAFLADDGKDAYLDCHPLPWKDWQYGGGLGRLSLVWPECFRKRLKPHSVLRYARAIYGRLYGTRILPGKKLPKDIQFWGRSSWYTVSEKCVEKCLSYLDGHPEFLDLFRRSLCGDEIFFPTLVNLTCDGDKIVNDNNLRYIDFTNGNKKQVGAPKTLQMEDVDAITASGAFFARKADLNCDRQIMEHFMEVCQR